MFGRQLLGSAFRHRNGDYARRGHSQFGGVMLPRLRRLDLASVVDRQLAIVLLGWNECLRGKAPLLDEARMDLTKQQSLSLQESAPPAAGSL